MNTSGLVGVLGGMGPLATLDFLHKLLVATPAACDQDHVPVVTASIPQVPDRAAAFRGEGASPLPAMVDSGRRLVNAGAGLVVVPCNTAHLWYAPLQAALDVPMLHLVDAALEDAGALVGPARRVGLLATDATIASGLYVERRPPGQGPVHWVLPDAGEMAALVMPGIRAVKAGDTASGRRLLVRAAQALGRRGAEVVVLGCTEIPVVLNHVSLSLPLVDATASLARRCVVWSQRRRAEALAA